MIGRQHIWLAYAIIAVISGGSLFAIIKDTEYWPFSPYGMYSDMRRERSLIRRRLFGVTAGDRSQETPLVDYQYIRPFDEERLSRALSRIPKKSDEQREALRDCLVRYEELRRAGSHHGPPLQGIRLYQVYWQLDPWARNVDQPNHRDLILEVMQAGKKDP
jgi:hypothetical protein